MKLMSDLEEFDEIQNKYDQLVWYVLAAIIIYGIPVFQIVFSYQQVKCRLWQWVQIDLQWHCT